MFYTMGQSAMFYTMGVGVCRAHSCPFAVVHGMETLLPTKANEGIFKALVERYIFFGILTLVKI